MYRMMTLVLTVFAATLAAQQGDAGKGRQTYTKVGCWQCHGREAQGGGYVGPRLAPDPIPYAALEAYLRSPSGDMPPYSKKVLPDADLRDIYAFLKTIPKPAAAKEIPLLNH